MSMAVSMFLFTFSTGYILRSSGDGIDCECRVVFCG